ncbi:hypothetical protein DJ568_07890 [Mucilaginibacter hurinus]|uniref:Uncharacterized protein n=1 Tax=Mucilaginibacter hurinus TaxID=2201324 RepID=A0A367GQW1_9SPHI|nr:hypothetical protein [Mucilaginibacter hurinus]RCH55103.1 hypothetical protein DJ568_07890 [Mucilaginibacter hurinus]
MKVMLKRLVYIFVLAWLIIVSAGLISADILQGNNQSRQAQSKPVSSVCAEEASYHEDSPESRDSKARSTRNRMRFLAGRSVDVSALLPYYQLVPGYLPVHIKQLYKKFIVRPAALPAYYAFLFRLSPF